MAIDLKGYHYTLGSLPSVFYELYNLEESAYLKEGARALAVEPDERCGNARLDPFESAIRTFAKKLSWHVSKLTAAWMAGYARVTAAIPHAPHPWSGRLIVATPLYVEYIDPPDGPHS